MIRVQYGRLILVAFLGGLVGGFISTQFLSGKVASAQGEGIQFKQRQIYAKTIIAEEYFLHGRNSKNALDSEIPVPRALLTTEPDGNPKLIMQDSSGNPRFSIILGDNDGTTLSILDMDGNKKVHLVKINWVPHWHCPMTLKINLAAVSGSASRKKTRQVYPYSGLRGVNAQSWLLIQTIPVFH